MTIKDIWPVVVIVVFLLSNMVAIVIGIHMIFIERQYHLLAIVIPSAFLGMFLSLAKD